MRNLLFLSVVMGLIMSAKAQVVVHELESVPMQKQPEKIDAELLFAPTSLKKLGDYNYNPNKPKRKSNVTYTYFGQISNLDFAAIDMPLALTKGFKTNLFPDSMAFRYQRDLGNVANTGKYYQFSSAIFVFDPYSASFDSTYSKGLFLDANGTVYSYRLDTLWTYVDYRLPQGYNSSSPDTLRIDLTYFHPYISHADSVDYMILTYVGYVLCPKVEYPSSIPQKGIGTKMKSTKRTIDYVLTNRDSVANVAPGATRGKLVGIPIPSGFAVPPGAVLGVLAKYIPGYDYNLNDTLEILTLDNSQVISHNVNKNIISIASWDYDTNTVQFLYDAAGCNTFLMEDKAIRYKKPVTPNETVCVNNSIYNPTYDLSPAFFMSLSKGDDTDPVSFDPCDYYVSTPVSIAGSMQGSNLVLNTNIVYDNYLWSTGVNTATLTAGTTGKYWVRATDICGNVFSDTVDVVFVSDSVCVGGEYDYQGLKFTIGDHAVRVGNTICRLILSAKYSPPAPTVTRNGSIFTSSSTDNNQWYLNDNILSGETGQTYDWTKTGSGKYSVVVTYPNGCTAKGEIGIYSISGRVRIQSGSKPVANLRINNNGDSVTVTISDGNYSFYVDGNSNAIVSPDTTNYTFDRRNYPLNNVTQNFSGRDFWATPKFEDTTRIADITIGNPIRIYPNPTDGKLTVTISDNQIYDIRVFDIVGKELSVGQSQIGQSEILLDVSHLASGMYYLKASGRVLKFVKQ